MRACRAPLRVPFARAGAPFACTCIAHSPFALFPRAYTYYVRHVRCLWWLLSLYVRKYSHYTPSPFSLSSAQPPLSAPYQADARGEGSSLLRVSCVYPRACVRACVSCVCLRDNVSAFSYMVRQTNNSGLVAISYMVRQAKSRKSLCLGTQDKIRKIHISQKFFVGFLPNLHQQTRHEIVHLFVYEVIVPQNTP